MVFVSYGFVLVQVQDHQLSEPARMKTSNLVFMSGVQVMASMASSSSGMLVEDKTYCQLQKSCRFCTEEKKMWIEFFILKLLLFTTESSQTFRVSPVRLLQWTTDA